MPIGLLGIAQGAIAIGQKLFGGIKRRREAKIAKKAQRLLEQQTNLQTVAKKFGFGSPGIVDGGGGFDFAQLGSMINNGAGTRAISSSAASLQAIKGGEIDEPTAANVALQKRVSDADVNKVNPLLLIGGGFLMLLLLLKKR